MMQRDPISEIRHLLIPIGAAMLLLGTAAAAAEPPNWSAVADMRTVFALTVDEDGSARRTKIWLVVVDGQGHIRTSQSTRWGHNVLRAPDIALEIEGVEYAVHARFIDDQAQRERIVRAFRAKYGWFDGFMQIFRGGEPHIIRLESRPSVGQ